MGGGLPGLSGFSKRPVSLIRVFSPSAFSTIVSSLFPGGLLGVRREFDNHWMARNLAATAWLGYEGSGSGDCLSAPLRRSDCAPPLTPSTSSCTPAPPPTATSPMPGAPHPRKGSMSTWGQLTDTGGGPGGGQDCSHLPPHPCDFAHLVLSRPRLWEDRLMTVPPRLLLQYPLSVPVGCLWLVNYLSHAETFYFMNFLIDSIQFKFPRISVL